jgi:hypothetical protein
MSHFSHPRYVHRGFDTPLSWRNGFIHLVAWFSGAIRRAGHRPGHFLFECSMVTDQVPPAVVHTVTPSHMGA